MSANELPPELEERFQARCRSAWRNTPPHTSEEKGTACIADPIRPLVAELHAEIERLRAERDSLVAMLDTICIDGQEWEAVTFEIGKSTLSYDGPFSKWSTWETVGQFETAADALNALRAAKDDVNERTTE